MIAAWAKRYVGIPFRWGGCDRNGADCFGLIRMIYRDEFSITIPPLEDADAEALLDARVRAGLIDDRQRAGAWRPIERDALEHGDAILLSVSGFPAHLAIYIGHGKMLHASEGAASCVERLDSAIWKRRILGCFRYFDGGIGHE